MTRAKIHNFTQNYCTFKQAKSAGTLDTPNKLRMHAQDRAMRAWEMTGTQGAAVLVVMMDWIRVWTHLDPCGIVVGIG